jgi:hypothetical protein
MSDSAPPQSTQIPELKSQVSDIVSKLPPFQHNSLASSEIDYYGASNTIARSLGLPSIPYTRASWSHGWFRYPLVAPELLINQGCVSCCKVREVPNLVATRGLEDFLKANDYPLAKAVGDPFIYTQDPAVERIPNSLLLIPEHSIKESNENYEGSKALCIPDSLDGLRERCSSIVACIGGFCVLRKNYVKVYEDAGIPWITGAWIHDAFALQRMRNLFSQFEYVATNAIGSHIPYAGYCGCKVSYYGKGHNRRREDYLGAPIYEKYPHLIDIVNEEQKLERFRERYPFLFKETEKSTRIKEWSSDALGLENKISDHQVAELIGWKIQLGEGGSWEYIPGENPGLDDDK